MWLTSKEIKSIDNYSSLIGRLMLISQKYEFTCKEMIKWLELISKLEGEELEFLSKEYLNYVDKLNGLLLGKSIKTLHRNQKLFNISDEQISILNNGRTSRNWIVHQSGKNLIFKSELLKEDYINFRKHVINLGRADFMVSKWSYEFHEKEPYNYIGEDNYTRMLLEWVFN
ncbi:hypothetical protein [Bacillus marinisedimentorum]|uniref:hypothetical protein n=1 Tax=Bacillus marinisedimentorum TaxID=1821260 RepID=UPI000872311A|nr:hypothetical protein [Bacillus marinisedimentorum]